MFEFTGLEVLHQDLIKKGEDRAVFPFKCKNQILHFLYL